MLWNASGFASKRLAEVSIRHRITARSRLQNPPIPTLPNLLSQDISNPDNFFFGEIRFGEVQDFVNQCVQPLAFALSRVYFDDVLTVEALSECAFATKFFLHNPDPHKNMRMNRRDEIKSIAIAAFAMGLIVATAWFLLFVL